MKRAHRPAASFVAVLLLLSALTGCAGTTPPPTDDSPGTLVFLESWPEGTDLDTPEFPEAYRTWPTVLASAKKNIVVGSFYFSRKGDGKDAAGPAAARDRLLPSLEALVDAAQHGVDVRILGDAKFQKNYPSVLAEMDALDGARSRAVDIGKHWGGVMHAKYFVVDDRTLYVGSQNWDWRALTQIRELGALMEHPRLARDLRRIFDMDWELAGGAPAPAPSTCPEARFQDLEAAKLNTRDGAIVSAYLAASPRAGLPEGIPWDLPLLLQMIDGAQERVRFQVLSYNVSNRDGDYFADLDVALRRVAARGVQVEMLVSNWSKVHYKLPWLQSLAAVQNITVKFSNIPDLEAGFIAYARVEHPKYMVVDGRRAWIGTSNWSGDYFHSSRNVSLFFEGEGAAAPLDRFFEKGWLGNHVEIVDPCGDYQPPRRK